MRFAQALIVYWLLPAALASTIPSTEENPTRTFTHKRQDGLQSDELAREARRLQEKYQREEQPLQWTQCNTTGRAPRRVARREWSSFSYSEANDYIEAVQCLGKLPPKTPKSVCPGCQNRYDDFVANHIMQTSRIHNTGNFLAWHRYFIWAYEQTLRIECGYRGYQPYYNWPRWSDDPEKSPALDGGKYSMGGNGMLGCTNQTFYGVPNNIDPIIKIPHGNGGGCIASGPFKNWTVNIGPILPVLSCTPPNPISDLSDPMVGLGYNPRCLKRDISKFAAQQWTNDGEVMKLLNSPDMKTFWTEMQGGAGPFTEGSLGVHAAGHITIGGDPGPDVFASPGDPWFFLHHAQIDRVWWTWQNQAPADRTLALYGTDYMLDPTARETQLDDEMHLGYAWGQNVTIRDMMSTFAGPLCYIYV